MFLALPNIGQWFDEVGSAMSTAGRLTPSSTSDSPGAPQIPCTRADAPAPFPHCLSSLRLLVHRSRQKIHPSLAAHATAPPFRGCQGIARVNLLNASVH